MMARRMHEEMGMNLAKLATAALAILALGLVAAAPVRAQEQKDDLEAFRADLLEFWEPLAETTKLLLNVAASEDVPAARLYAAVPLATVEPDEIRQVIAALTTEQLQELKQQFDTVQGWQQMGLLLQSAIPPDVRANLVALGAANRPFPATNGVAATICGIAEASGIDTLQDKQTASQVALGIYETLEAIAIPFDVACDASPCSVAFFDLPVVGPLKVALCGVATVTRIAAAVSRAVVDSTRDCNVWTFYDGVEQRVDARLSSVASIDSVGLRNGTGFNSATIHEKLEDRLDVVTTTRGTQDSVDGQRAGRPPSPAKSVRTVVDHTDQVRLPDLERVIDETLALAKQQGNLMRDFRDLLIRMQVEADLLDRGKGGFREALFQLPETIPGHKRAFCSRNITIPCIAPGPDRQRGTDDDVTDVSLCPDDSQPAELCDYDFGVCERTRAMPCTADPDCPAGEACEMTSHPCSTSRDRECSFNEDCPVGRPKQECVEADRQRGFFDLVRETVVETIDMTLAAGQQTSKADKHLARADALLAGGDFKNAYSYLRLAYQDAARLRNGR